MNFGGCGHLYRMQVRCERGIRGFFGVMKTRFILRGRLILFRGAGCLAGGIYGERPETFGNRKEVVHVIPRC